MNEDAYELLIKYIIEVSKCNGYEDWEAKLLRYELEDKLFGTLEDWSPDEQP